MQPSKILKQNIVVANCRDMLSLLRKASAGTKSLFVTFFAITALSVVLFSFGLLNSGITAVLSSSTATPWGVATSIFIHGGGLNHLLSNVVALLIMFILFSLTRISVKNSFKPRGTGWFIGLVFTAGIVANVIFLFLSPSSASSGLSGVVFAAQGVVLALSLLNALNLPTYHKPITPEGRRTLTLWVVNVMIFAVTIANIAVSPSLFLATAPGVNVFVHGVSFLIAFMFPLTTLQFRVYLENLGKGLLTLKR